MIDLEVLKDLLGMVFDGETDVVDVKGGRKLTKDEIKEFIEDLCELCDGADGIEIKIDDGPDDSDEKDEELSELSEEAKKTIANDRAEYGEEYVLDKINIADAMTKIAFAMDEKLPIRAEDVAMYNALSKKMSPQNTYPEYVKKQYKRVDEVLKSTRKELGL